MKPTGGRAVVAGHDVVTDPAGVRASIGYMSASTGIYDRMTAWELVEYFGRLYGVPREHLRERMEDIFNWLKMNDFRDVLGSKMSTGMKQKVSIARTIVHDPPVLIFDEPTSGLDVLVARAVLQNILELRDRGKTIVFSTHSMHEVEKLCSRVAIIHKGRVQAEGAPQALLDQFDQPDLEELFFYLVERADSWRARPPVRRCGPRASPADNSTVPSRSIRENHGELFHALVEPLHHFPPRGSRPDPRPAHAVHDFRAADLALSDPGDRRDQVCDGARAEAAGGGRGGCGVSAEGAAPC